MIKCPDCGEAFRTATASGIVARGQATVTFDNNGMPALVSPIRCVWSVKRGYELQSQKFWITCPMCRKDNEASAFQVARVSYMSDLESTFSVTVGKYIIPVANEEEAQQAQSLAPYLEVVASAAYDNAESDTTIAQVYRGERWEV